MHTDEPHSYVISAAGLQIRRISICERLVRTPVVESGLLAAVPARMPGALEHLVGEVARGDAVALLDQHHRVDPAVKADTASADRKSQHSRGHHLRYRNAMEMPERYPGRFYKKEITTQICRPTYNPSINKE